MTAREAIPCDGSNLVAGESRTAGASFQAFDPRTGRNLPMEFHEATDTDVADAAGAAANAFEELRRWPGRRRGDLLRAIADHLDALEGQLVTVVDAETALGPDRVRGELARTSAQARMFADVATDGSYVDAIIDTADPDARPVPRPDLRRMFVPVGPVAVFEVSNFPLAFGAAGTDTVSALAAGCPVVVKGHPLHPHTAELCARAVLAACDVVGAPAGTFSLLQGTRHAVGEALVDAPEMRAVGFTGSPRGGQALRERASRRPIPIPVFAEMGSINPVFVTTGVIETRLEGFADGYVGSMTMGTGQFCTKPGLLVVPEGSVDLVADALVERLKDVPVGYLLGREIASALTSGLGRMGQIPGVDEVLPAEVGSDQGYGCTPGLLRTNAHTFLSQPKLVDELFGPAALMVSCSPGRYSDIARCLPGSLAAAVHATDSELASLGELCDVLTAGAGRLVWNAFPTGVSVIRAMHHGGPFPATNDPAHTSVGELAIRRWLRGVAYQDLPDLLLPQELQNANPRGVLRSVDGGNPSRVSLGS